MEREDRVNRLFKETKQSAQLAEEIKEAFLQDIIVDIEKELKRLEREKRNNGYSRYICIVFLMYFLWVNAVAIDMIQKGEKTGKVKQNS